MALVWGDLLFYLGLFLFHYLTQWKTSSLILIPKLILNFYWLMKPKRWGNVAEEISASHLGFPAGPNTPERYEKHPQSSRASAGLTVNWNFGFEGAECISEWLRVLYTRQRPQEVLNRALSPLPGGTDPLPKPRETENSSILIHQDILVGLERTWTLYTLTHHFAFSSGLCLSLSEKGENFQGRQVLLKYPAPNTT